MYSEKSLAEDYKEYCSNFKRVWGYLQSHSKPLDDIVSEICEHRLYFDSHEKWKNILSDIGVVCVDEDTCDYDVLKVDRYKDMALFSDDGYFILNKRYVFAIKDMLGNIVALVGWYPDNKRYITTPSKYFTKNSLFFGMEQLGKTGIGKEYILVEGIFDCLSIRALGFNCVAQMGIDSSRVKKSLYGLFKKLVGIPDNDKQGRRVLANDLWYLPRNSCYLKWVGSLGEGEDAIHIKDIDKFCNLFEESSVKELLSSCFKSNSRVVKVEL